MKIAFVDLKEKVPATLTGKGFSDEDAKSITDDLVGRSFRYQNPRQHQDDWYRATSEYSAKA